MANLPALQKFNGYLTHEKTQNYLSQVLGSNKEKFVTNVTALVTNNHSLAECEPNSLMSCAIVATSLNLSLNSSFGYAYVVPYNNKKAGIKEAQFQIGYKGYIQLAMRTGQYAKLNSVPIYENQFISYNEVFEDLQLHNTEGKGKVVGYVAYFKMVNGFEKLIYWSYEKMIDHADKYSQAFSRDAKGGQFPKVSYEDFVNGKVAQSDVWKYSSFWYKDFDEMAKKTMLRQLLSKYGILTEDIQTAYASDHAVIRGEERVYVDNVEEARAQVVEIEQQADQFEEAPQAPTINFNELQSN